MKVILVLGDINMDFVIKVERVQLSRFLLFKV
jgi:hypothetical protein